MSKYRISAVWGALLLTACTGQSAPTPTPTPTPAEMLDRSAQAMRSLSSAKFQLVREGAPAVLDPNTGFTLTEASGQYQAPDRVSATIKVSLLGNPLEIRMLWLPEGSYITNPLTQTFEQAPDDTGFDGAGIFAEEGMPGLLEQSMQELVLVGEEAVEGRQTIHLQAQADGEDLSSVTAGALATEAAYPVDIWLDKAEFFLVRIQINEPDGNRWLIDFYDFNIPNEIQAP